MDHPLMIAELVARLRCGDDSGVELLFQQFTERLIQLARSRIASYYRNRVDPEDIVQSVFKSFLIRFRDRKLDFQTDEGLWGLLTVITVRKCADRIEHLRAGCRDVRRELPLRSGSSSRDSPWTRVLDREPSPAEVCMLAEMVEQLLLGFDPEDRPVVEAQLQGLSSAETAAQLHRAERSVRRIRERVRQRLLKQLSEPDENVATGNVPSSD